MATDTLKRGARSLAERGLARITVDVPTEDVNTLEETARLTGYNKTTTLMRAIRLLATLEHAVRNGGSITLTHGDGTKERLLLR